MSEEIARRIRSALAEEKVLPRKVAELVGVDAATVRNWRNGVHRATPEGLAAIAKLTRRPLSYFMDDEAPPAPESPPSSQRHPGIDAMIAILQASPRDNAALLAELEALLTAKLPRPLNLPGQALDVALALLRESPE